MEDVIVIYYDGSEHKAKRYATDFKDSSQPHIFGLPSDNEVIAVIANLGKHTSVFIDELCVIGEGE